MDSSKYLEHNSPISSYPIPPLITHHWGPGPCRAHHGRHTPPELSCRRCAPEHLSPHAQNHCRQGSGVVGGTVVKVGRRKEGEGNGGRKLGKEEEVCVCVCVGGWGWEDKETCVCVGGGGVGVGRQKCVVVRVEEQPSKQTKCYNHLQYGETHIWLTRLDYSPLFLTLYVLLQFFLVSNILFQSIDITSG